MSTALRMAGISKRFGQVQALYEVNLTVQKGEIHAIVGENGAGKTTLMRILYGGERQDSGTIEIDGTGIAFSNAADGIAAGIGMVSQHYSIIPELTCLENLMLGAEPHWLINKNASIERAAALAEQMDFEFDWSAKAEVLSPSGAQKLEILKLLWRNARLMILDEPTAMLSPMDSDSLFESLRQLANNGATVIVVTHRIPEVLHHCDSVTVLRGGQFVSSLPVSETNTTMLAELIVGKAVNLEARESIAPGGEVALECSDVSVKGYRGDEAVKSVSFSIAKGEIVGIAGVDGSGQRELFWSLIGKLKPIHGSIRFLNEDISGYSIKERLQRGFRLIPEDRHEEGVVDDWSLLENAAIGLQNEPEFSSGRWINQTSRKQQCAQIAERFHTKHGGLEKAISGLSGGNQQRFVAARALAIRPKAILAFQPARGLDIEAARNVYDAIAEECKSGAFALIVSFDLDELLNHCDRVLVMNSGKLYVPAEPEQRDRAAIGKLMVASQ